MLVLKTVAEKDKVDSPVEAQYEKGPEKVEPEIIYVASKEDLLEIESYVYQQNMKQIFMDTETTGLNPLFDDLVLLQISAGNKVFVINTIHIGKNEENILSYNGIKLILEDPDKLKVFHNAKFDLKFLKHHLFNNDIQFKNLVAILFHAACFLQHLPTNLITNII